MKSDECAELGRENRDLRKVVSQLEEVNHKLRDRLSEAEKKLSVQNHVISLYERCFSPERPGDDEELEGSTKGGDDGNAPEGLSGGGDVTAAVEEDKAPHVSETVQTSSDSSGSGKNQVEAGKEKQHVKEEENNCEQTKVQVKREQAEPTEKAPQEQKAKKRKLSMWTQEDEARFLEAYNKHGCQWKLVHEDLPQKSRQQIQSHGNYLIRSGKIPKLGIPSKNMARSSSKMDMSQLVDNPDLKPADPPADTNEETVVPTVEERQNREDDLDKSSKGLEEGRPPGRSERAGSARVKQDEGASNDAPEEQRTEADSGERAARSSAARSEEGSKEGARTHESALKSNQGLVAKREETASMPMVGSSHEAGEARTAGSAPNQMSKQEMSGSSNEQQAKESSEAPPSNPAAPSSGSNDNDPEAEQPQQRAEPSTEGEQSSQTDANSPT